MLSASDVRTLPKFNPLPEGLPGPRAMPGDGEWVDAESMRRYTSGTFLPDPLDTEVNRRLVVCEGYPALAQKHVDWLGRVHATEIEGALDLAKTKYTLEWVNAEIERQEPADEWMVRALIAVGALATGTIVTLALTR